MTDLVLATSHNNYSEHVERLATLGLSVYVISTVDFETVIE